MKMNIIIAGVGGQGILLASRVLGCLAMAEGNDVKVSEVHGMSQRGGDVITHVRIGEEVYSPLIEEGTADVVIAFEQLEALRALPLLKRGGRIIVNTQKMMPMPVLTGAASYPEDIMEKLEAHGSVLALDAMAVAKACGVERAVNIVLLGAFASTQAIAKEAWLQAVETCVPKRAADANREAFVMGWRIANEHNA